MTETIIHTTSIIQKAQCLASHIGQTPLFDISKIQSNPNIKIYAKLEWNQLSNSVKARAAYRIIMSAIEKGLINENKGIIDASSGNTAVAYATIGANIGLPVTLCVPENASCQKKTALKALGANIIFTSKFGTTDEAQIKAKELSQLHPDLYYYTDQYANEDNWKAHYHTTAIEIWEQTQSQVTHFVAGLGTTGTFTGTSRRLKELNPFISLTSLQPDSAMHGLEGWKHLESALVPKIYDENIADQNLFIDTIEAFDMIKLAAQRLGLLLSPSSAANLVGTLKVAQSISSGVIVTIFPDHASNYPDILDQIL
ncbi:MAG: cysteine synthase family protein [Chitinophagales bacterium]|nr:cysteine synthase family protein [Chitinophagales bacterium]MCZ2392237.1 cysteine synthase family protein [Chitinophagales bacterium]